jgi:putative two-component system response regulator
VDDEKPVTALFARLLAREGYAIIVAHDGASALRLIAANPPDVILTDVMMPGLDGLAVCRHVKRDPQTRLTPVVLVTALTAREHRIEGLEAGADDFLSKPVDAQELLARVRASIRTKRYTDDLDSAAAIIMTLAEMIEARDEHTDGHCYRIAHYATALGRRLGLDSDALQALYRGGFLHDIGMLAIPDPVLRKVGPLEPEEYELIKSHTTIGDSLVGNLRSMQAVRPIVRHHHERYDGSGYPDGLQGDDIPLLAQILSIIDVYDAMTSHRPYQRAKSVDEGIAILRTQVTRGWRRPDLVEEFAALIAQGGVGSGVAPQIQTIGTTMQ